jgi:four helix bundle protein
MGRLQTDFLERVESFCDRVLDVVQSLADTPCPRRLADQLSASGTSVGANAYEADEALSRADFCKTLGIVIKELNETRFWLRLVARRGWISPERLAPLETEARELKLIFGSILSKSRPTPKRPS